MFSAIARVHAVSNGIEAGSSQSDLVVHRSQDRRYVTIRERLVEVANSVRRCLPAGAVGI